MRQITSWYWKVNAVNDSKHDDDVGWRPPDILPTTFCCSAWKSPALERKIASKNNQVACSLIPNCITKCNLVMYVCNLWEKRLPLHYKTSIHHKSCLLDGRIALETNYPNTFLTFKVPSNSIPLSWKHCAAIDDISKWHYETGHLPSSTPKQVKTKGLNYLHHQLEWGPPWVVHRIILPFASKRLWSQRGWHARTRACQGEYTANGTAQQPLSHSIQPTLQRNVILYGPFNTLQIHFPSITTAQTHNKASKRRYRTSFSLCQSLLPSLWLSACPLVRRNQPVSPLWADMAACSPLRRPVAATKQAIWSYWGVLAMWHLESGHPAESYQEGNSD